MRRLSLPCPIRITLLLLLLLGLLYGATERMVFHPPQPPWYQPNDSNIVNIGPLKALWLSHPQAKSTILYNHGHATDIGYDYYYMQTLRNMGYNVLGYDYRGYGHSRGVASEKHCYQDSETAFNYLTHTLKIPENRIILYGHSLGSALAIRLAAKHDVAGLILIAPFLSSNRTLTQWRIFPWDFFDSTEWIKQVKAPILFLQGTHNSTAPIWQSRQLYKMAQAPKKLTISLNATTTESIQESKCKADALLAKTLEQISNGKFHSE